MMDTSVRDASGCKATPVAVQLSLLALSKISIMILGSKMHLRIYRITTQTRHLPCTCHGEDSMKTEARAQWKVCMQHSRNLMAQQCWEGNPATSAEVDDVMASIKHKVSAKGCDCILTWSMMTCLELESALHFISLVLTSTLDFLPLLQQLGLFGLGMVITCISVTAY
ncbi:hypothetical protein J3A83DRAFT_4249157 [Scleroderma citrinum]